MARRLFPAGARGAAALLAGALLLVAGCVSKKDFTAKSQELDMAAVAMVKERQKAAELESRLAETGRALESARGEAARLADQLAEARARSESLERQLELAQEAASQKDGNVHDLTARYDDLIKDLERQKAELAKRTQELSGRLAEAEARVVSLTGELASARQALTTAQTELGSSRDELTATRDALAETRRSLGETQEQLAERERKLREATATYDKLVADLKGEIADGQVKITRLRDRLTVNLVDKILFDSGSIAIKSHGKEVLLKVAQVLRTVKGKRVQIEGHTDNIPVRGALRKQFPTNWELSTSRATVVARFLAEQGGIDPAMLVAAGYGQYRPVASNDTPERRAQNRRIEIVLLPASLDTAS
jgi:chemotaxis protein MotB